MRQFEHTCSLARQDADNPVTWRLVASARTPALHVQCRRDACYAVVRGSSLPGHPRTSARLRHGPTMKHAFVGPWRATHLSVEQERFFVHTHARRESRIWCFDMFGRQQLRFEETSVRHTGGPAVPTRPGSSYTASGPSPAGSIFGHCYLPPLTVRLSSHKLRRGEK